MINYIFYLLYNLSIVYKGKINNGKINNGKINNGKINKFKTMDCQ